MGKNNNIFSVQLRDAICKVGLLVPLCDILLHHGAPRVNVEERLCPQDGGGAEQPAKQRAREAAPQHVLGCFT